MRGRQVNVATPTTEPEAQSINHEKQTEWLQTRPAERCLIRISAADTNGAYSLVEIVSDPDDGTPVHIKIVPDAALQTPGRCLTSGSRA
jgi:hypothetical protein